MGFNGICLASNIEYGWIWDIWQYQWALMGYPTIQLNAIYPTTSNYLVEFLGTPCLVDLLDWPPWRFSGNFEDPSKTLECWKITYFAADSTCFWLVKIKGLTLQKNIHRAMYIAGGYLTQNHVLTVPLVLTEFECYQVIVGWFRGCHTAWIARPR